MNERIVVDILKDSVDANPGSRGTPSRWVAGSRTDRQTDRPTMPTSISGCKYVHWLYLSSFLVGTLCRRSPVRASAMTSPPTPSPIYFKLASSVPDLPTLH